MSGSIVAAVKPANHVTASESLGIVKAVFDLINSSNPVNQAANNIIRWLGRECISESDFEYCMTKCHELAYPNERGLAIRASINRSFGRIMKAGGMNLIAVGSVGRQLAFSEQWAYMVTTAAAIMADHGPEFVVKVLCQMALYQKGSVLDGNVPYPQYAVERARLQGVLTRITDSILLNVVNCGHTATGLPEEFNAFCAHLTDASTYASLIMRIAKSTSDVLLVCDRFQGDLLLWVLNHFDGSIEVSAGGKSMPVFGTSEGKRRFRMVVKEVCRADCRKERHRIEICELLGTSWTHVMEATDDPTCRKSPVYRLPLYSIEPAAYSRRRDILSREVKYEVRILAQRFLLWLLNLQLRVNVDFTTVGLEVVFDGHSGDASLRIADLLCCSPSLLHDKQGQTVGTLTEIAFKAPEATPSQPSDVIYEPDLQPISEFCSCFPAVAGLVDSLQQQCRCRVCRNSGSIDDAKEGCLPEAAINQFLVLIGNAIADGFGVQDAAGVIDHDEYTAAVRRVLWQLLEGRVWWDDWFNISASTALGYLPKGVLGRGHIGDGGNALVAVQYGSMVVAARWLDLTRPMSAKGCFAADVAEGQIQGVRESCVFLFTEMKTTLHGDLQNANTTIAGTAFTDLKHECMKGDECATSLEHAIIGTADDQSKRLLTIIGAGSALRIIDPADALLSTLRSTTLATNNSTMCQHKRSRGQVPAIPHGAPILTSFWYFWDLEKMITDWEGGNEPVYASTTLDTDLKVNIALSLSVQGCLLRNSLSCLLCACELLHQSTTLPGRIINYNMNHRALPSSS